MSPRYSTIMDLEAREFTTADRQRWRGFTAYEPTTVEGWLELAELVASRVGIRRMVDLGDPKAWRQAIADTCRYPLPPLNLPLPIWESYLAQPFSAIKFHFADGPIIPVPGWSKVYYCWHTRTLALDLDNEVAVRAATAVVAVQAADKGSTQISTLERLRWFQQADPFVAIAIRTSDGNVILVEHRDRFQVDESGSLVAIASGAGPRIQLVKVCDILSVRSMTEQTGLLDRLTQALKESPFRPFQVRFCNGVRWTIDRPQGLLVTKQRLYLGQVEPGRSGYESVCQAGAEWIEAIDSLPLESEQPEPSTPACT